MSSAINWPPQDLDDEKVLARMAGVWARGMPTMPGTLSVASDCDVPPSSDDVMD